MKSWKPVLIVTLISVAICAIYLFFVWHQRQNPGINPQAGQPLSKDDVAVVRMLDAAHFEDVATLVGTSVWMKNGYVMPYFPYTAVGIQFSKRVGLIPPAQRMDVKKVVKAAVPTQVEDSVEHGSRQVFLVFALPGDPQLYATPTGYLAGDREFLYCDLLYFYDDPHGIYSHWPKDIWTAIDAHQIKPGMSEIETRMAIGQKLSTASPNEGDRTIQYDMNGKIWTVTYVKDKAAEIRSNN